MNEENNVDSKEIISGTKEFVEFLMLSFEEESIGFGMTLLINLIGRLIFEYKYISEEKFFKALELEEDGIFL